MVAAKPVPNIADSVIKRERSVLRGEMFRRADTILPARDTLGCARGWMVFFIQPLVAMEMLPTFHTLV
jgi:hypothetical protein